MKKYNFLKIINITRARNMREQIVIVEDMKQKQIEQSYMLRTIKTSCDKVQILEDCEQELLVLYKRIKSKI